MLGFSSMNGKGYLHSLFVHKNQQGKGIATQLLFEVERIAKQYGATEITSEVSLTARPFFEKKGYKVVKTQKCQANKFEKKGYKVVKTQKCQANKLKLTNFVMLKSLINKK